MESNKFSDLCQAYSKAQTNFQNFQDECHDLALNLVKDLKAYYQIPDSQFSLFQIGQNREFNLVQPAVVNALTLRPDSMWQFGIGLTVCSSHEKSPQELILIHILIRKDVEENFYLRYGEEDKDHLIEKTDKWNFIPFFDFLHETIIDVYEQQLVHFMSQDSRRKIGY